MYDDLDLPGFSCCERSISFRCRVSKCERHDNVLAVSVVASAFFRLYDNVLAVPSVASAFFGLSDNLFDRVSVCERSLPIPTQSFAALGVFFYVAIRSQIHIP
jgi:hypothetical protein